MNFNVKVIEANKQTEKLTIKGLQVFKCVLVKKEGQVGMSQSAMMSINVLDSAGLHKVGDVLNLEGAIHKANMINQAGETVPVQWFEPA